MGPEQLRAPPPSLRDARDFGPPSPASDEEKGETSSVKRGYGRSALEPG